MMRKVILNVAVSLDGFIEGPNGEFDWCFTDQDYGMKKFLSSVDTIFFGRKSYEALINFEKNPYPDVKKCVFSRTLKSAPGAVLIRNDVERTVQSMKAEQGKNIWLFGGADLTRQLLDFGLVDELQLAVHPLLLGNGRPLFSGTRNRIRLTLVDSKVYSTGLVQFFYKPASPSPE